MTKEFQSALAKFDYAFPHHLIAQAPARPRDSAGLLVYNKLTKQESWTTFKEIGSFLKPGTLLVLNQTKVLPARVTVSRTTGGKADLLWLGNRDQCIRVLSNRKLRKDEKLAINDEYAFVVREQCDKEWILEPLFPMNQLLHVLDTYGVMPLPPYIKHTPLSSDQLKTEYQSVFAKESGSIAAPTASIHFTEKLLTSLRSQGIEISFVTLHVHLGTFSPLTEEQWQTGKLHEEYFSIAEPDRQAIMRAKNAGRSIIAVGTTVTRALESSSDDCGRIIKPEGMTRMFIREPYQFKIVDGMVTNFHVPKSSLLMLVSAFVGCDVLMHLYSEAIKREFRLFSFGDAMMIL